MPFLRARIELKFGDAIKKLPTARSAEAVSVDNADSTLRIVKERQPIQRSAHVNGSRATHVCDVLMEMVEVNGIEPMTPCLQSRCSPS